jgi:3-methylfumaryl-CoA hydratase
MSETLNDLKRFIGRKENATDIVTASAMLKITAALGLDNPAFSKGDPIPPGWHGAFFPRLYGPREMRADGQAAGHGIVPNVPLPRRRLGGVRIDFHQPLRIGDELTRVTEIVDISYDENESGPRVVIVERNSISNADGLAVVEERDLIFLGEGRAELTSTAPPAIPTEATWRQVIDPNPVLLFRFAAIKFNSHRIHYDRDYATKVEGLPGLLVQAGLLTQLLIEMCRKELPQRRMTDFDYETHCPIYDTGPFTIAGKPLAEGREAMLWAITADGKLAVTATAKFA